MDISRLARWRRSLEALFPERHLYVRSGGEMRAFVLSTGRQLALASAVGVTALWMGVCTAAMLVNALSVGAVDQKFLQQRAYYERLNADRQARLNSAVDQLTSGAGSLDQLAQTASSRHAALAMLLSEFKGVPGAAQALAPVKLAPSPDANPLVQVRQVLNDQERLIAQAEVFAKTRADRLRLAMRLAGLDPAAYSKGATSSMGGPLIEAKDSTALAAILDVDESVARRVQQAARDVSAMRSLNTAAERLPLGKPTFNTRRASGYGARIDPFTFRSANHTGLDFAGPRMTPIYSTAPGVVSFTGVRSGYGNTIEIDHGGGFKTRYGHLAAISVARGQRVALGQRIGGMGSTGRSTGPHLHYEVWVNGQHRNPDRFLKAGEYVQQAS